MLAAEKGIIHGNTVVIEDILMQALLFYRQRILIQEIFLPHYAVSLIVAITL